MFKYLYNIIVTIYHLMVNAFHLSSKDNPSNFIPQVEQASAKQRRNSMADLHDNSQKPQRPAFNENWQDGEDVFIYLPKKVPVTEVVINPECDDNPYGKENYCGFRDNM